MKADGGPNLAVFYKQAKTNLIQGDKRLYWGQIMESDTNMFAYFAFKV